MKKLILLSLFGLVCQLSFTQITSADYGNIGDTSTLGWKFNASILPGSPGSGQTWDFTNVGTDVVNYIYFVNPVFVPNSSNFPSANLATISYLEGIRFLEKTSGYLTYHGGVEVIVYGSATDYTPSVDWIQFPANLGTNFSSSSNSDATSDYGIDTSIFSCDILIDSVRTKRAISLNVNFDATGQIFLPTDT